MKPRQDKSNGMLVNRIVTKFWNEIMSVERVS